MMAQLNSTSCELVNPPYLLHVAHQIGAAGTHERRQARPAEAVSRAHNREVAVSSPFGTSCVLMAHEK